MRKAALLVAAAVSILGTRMTPADALGCRAAGVRAAIGETLCIPTHRGSQLARCSTVLNVSSWIFLGGSCSLPPAPASKSG